jgi:hypothetical protein
VELDEEPAEIAAVEEEDAGNNNNNNNSSIEEDELIIKDDIDNDCFEEVDAVGEMVRNFSNFK